MGLLGHNSEIKTNAQSEPARESLWDPEQVKTQHEYCRTEFERQTEVL